MTDDQSAPDGTHERTRTEPEQIMTNTQQGPNERPADPPQTESTRIGSRAVAITATVLGSIALVASGTGVAYGAVYDSVAGAGSSATHSESAAGVRSLEIDHEFGELQVVFDPAAAQATLTTQGEIAERMTLERDGGTLRVVSREDGLPFGDWGWVFGDWRDQYASLTLPASMEGADLTIDSGAGFLHAEGDFGAVEVSNGAGEVQVSGSAESAVAEIGAGHVQFSLDGVETVDADVSAGGFTGDFTGEAPSSIVVDISAGGADITVPDEEYRLLQDVSAGEVDQGDLRVASDAPRVIDVTLSAGGVTLRTQEGAGY